jgi:ATP-dependent RNA helicase DDX1
MMHFPTWVDLKGQDSVPETVHHVLCYVDPNTDTSWHSLPRKVKVRWKGEREREGGREE